MYSKWVCKLLDWKHKNLFLILSPLPYTRFEKHCKLAYTRVVRKMQYQDLKHDAFGVRGHLYVVSIHSRITLVCVVASNCVSVMIYSETLFNM